MIRALLVLCLMFPVQSAAQTDAALQARLAVEALDIASQKLAQADSARDRVRALTETIQAYEAGLGAMRSGMRLIAVQETQLSQQLVIRNDEIATLLIVLQNIGPGATPDAFLHPAGPAGTARAGLLLAEMAPLLNERAASLRRELEDVQMLRALQTEAADRLEAGLQDVQAARTALNQAMAERTELPLQFTNDPVRMAILLASTDTLDGFAAALDEMVLDPSVLPRLTLNEQKGALSLPVQGVVLRAAGEVDAAGVSRPGLLIATRPRAIVTSPAAATIRYTGPLLDLGEVVILEPQGGTLFVLAGLDVVYAQAGEVIDAGAPLGLMGSKEAINGSDLSTDGDDTGTGRTETLYMEVRQNDIPEDPEDWFRTDKDG